jgi:hypothetical protein
MLAKTEKFIEKNELDVLFLVIRQFPLMPLHKPLIKYENKDGGISWALHPALFRRNLNWSKKFTQYYTLNEYIHKEKSRFGLRDLNLLAGLVLGLYRWAPEFVMQEVKKVRDLCEQKGVKLIVLSTQQYPTSVMGDIACKKISEKLANWCRTDDINYVNIIDLGPPEFFAEDRVHFSADCHKLIAAKLYDAYSELHAAKDRIGSAHEMTAIFTQR